MIVIIFWVSVVVNFVGWMCISNSREGRTWDSRLFWISLICVLGSAFAWLWRVM